MKKVLIVLAIVFIAITIWLVRVKTKPYTEEDTQRVLDIYLGKKKANLKDFIRLDMNHDLKFKLNDAVAVQKKVLGK